MSDVEARQVERMKTLLTAQKSAFAAAPRRPIALRKEDLLKIETFTRDRADDICKAISADFGTRSLNESLIGEAAVIVGGARHARQKLGQWMKPKRVPVESSMQPARAYIRREPKGVVGIIGPWNYPYQLALAPLIAALAAGCRAIIKPSELTPRTSELLQELISAAFDENHVAVVTGGPVVGQAFSALAFDHLFFTGSTGVGRAVAMAAAANLTPVTLELGGKSPVLVLDDIPVETAAQPIAWGKLFNAGQTCIAPDHVYAPRAKVQALGEAVIAKAAAFYADAAGDADYTSIVADRHYERLAAMIDEVRSAGATVLQPEHDAAAMKAARKIPPTVVLNPPADCQMMREEIFGPILPVIGYDALEDPIATVNAGERPLALYVFSKDKRAARAVLDATISGGAVINSTLIHYSFEELPFGGVGASGQGAYHGERGFLEFCHERGVVEAPLWHPSRLLAPPYRGLFRFIAKHQMRK